MVAVVALLLVPHTRLLYAYNVSYRPGLDAALAEAREHVRPGDRLFVSNVDNSTAFINAPFLYWALEARPASRVTHFDPGYADQDDVQREIVEELCAARPLVVQWYAPVDEETSGSDVLDELLADAYRPVLDDGEFVVLEPNGDGC